MNFLYWQNILEKTENTVMEENQEDLKEKNKVLTLSFK